MKRLLMLMGGGILLVLTACAGMQTADIPSEDVYVMFISPKGEYTMGLIPKGHLNEENKGNTFITEDEYKKLLEKLEGIMGMEGI